MIEGIIDRLTLSADPAGSKIDDYDRLPDSTGLSFIVQGHQEPVELVKSASGPSTVPLEAGESWFVGPYRRGSDLVPKFIRTTNGQTTGLEVLVVQDNSKTFQIRRLNDRTVDIDDADAIDVEMDYVEGERLELTGQGSAQPVLFKTPDGTDLTRSFEGTDGFVDLRPFTEATVATDAAVNGGGDSTTVDIEGLRTRSGAPQSLISKTVAPGDGEAQVFRGDVSDLSWLRTTEDSPSSDHSFYLVLK
jgi:hypothetical protein